MEKRKIYKIIYIALIIIPYIISFILFGSLPDNIPVHFSNGVADRYGSRWEIFTLPVITSIISIAFYIFLKNLELNPRTHKLGTTLQSFDVGLLIIGLTLFAINIWCFILLYKLV